MTKKQLEITKSCAVVWQNVEYLKHAKGLTDKDLQKVLGRSKSTVINRRQHPKNTTLEDVVKLGMYFGIQPASLLVPLMPRIVPAIDECVDGAEDEE